MNSSRRDFAPCRAPHRRAAPSLATRRIAMRLLAPLCVSAPRNSLLRNASHLNSTQRFIRSFPALRISPQRCARQRSAARRMVSKRRSVQRIGSFVSFSAPLHRAPFLAASNRIDPRLSASPCHAPQLNATVRLTIFPAARLCSAQLSSAHHAFSQPSSSFRSDPPRDSTHRFICRFPPPRVSTLCGSARLGASIRFAARRNDSFGHFFASLCSAALRRATQRAAPPRGAWQLTASVHSSICRAASRCPDSQRDESRRHTAQLNAPVHSSVFCAPPLRAPQRFATQRRELLCATARRAEVRRNSSQRPN